MTPKLLNFVVRILLQNQKCLCVPYLLGRLQADWHQTWQEDWGWALNTPCRTRFHGNQCVAMATKNDYFYGKVTLEVMS